MANPEAELEQRINDWQKARTDFGTWLDNVEGKDLDAIGDLHSQVGVSQIIKKTVAAIREMRTIHFSDIPPEAATRLEENARLLSLRIDEALSISAGNLTTPKQEAGTILGIMEIYDNVFDLRAILISSSLYTSFDIPAAIQEVQQGQEEIKRTKADAEAITAELREMVKKSGVVAQEQRFLEEAKEHKEEADSWLWASILLGIVSGLAGFLFLYYPFESDATNGRIAFHLLGRFAIFSALLVLLVWTLRTHGAHRHNYVVNRHRANALATYPLFVEAVDKEDKETRQAILLQATQAIFDPQQSGFLHKPIDTSGASKATEVVLKNVLKS